MNQTPSDLLKIANDALDLARRHVLSHVPQDVTSKADRDLVSDIDLTIERDVRALLHERTPEVGFLGEEGGWSNGLKDRAFWALDPIDGTSNLVKQLPLCAVSLAYIDGERSIVGAVDLPFFDMRYTAVAGEGAFRSGKQLRATGTRHLGDAVVSIGDYAVGEGADAKNSVRLAVTEQLAQAVQRVRMLGSAAIDLVWVAEGRLDASVMLSNKPWDTAAGVLIAREAGAQVVDAHGDQHTLRSGSTIAAAPSLVADLSALVRAVAVDGERHSPNPVSGAGGSGPMS